VNLSTKDGYKQQETLKEHLSFYAEYKTDRRETEYETKTTSNQIKTQTSA
jgi:hypothetical protein